jgi:hypothetical protein
VRFIFTGVALKEKFPLCRDESSSSFPTIIFLFSTSFLESSVHILSFFRTQSSTLHLSHSLTPALLSSLLASTLNSHPTTPAAPLRRSDDLNFQLLGPDAPCGNFELDNGKTFKAICVGDTAESVTSMNMDQCILN